MSKAVRWQLQDAKNRFSEVVDEAIRSGPQIITRHGAETAVVVSFDEWTRLSRRRGRLIDVLRRAPRIPGGLAISPARELRSSIRGNPERGRSSRRRRHGAAAPRAAGFGATLRGMIAERRRRE